MSSESSIFPHLHGVALTDVGRKRKNNEDSYGEYPGHGVWCVADGMGGGDDGEIASAAVVKSVDAFLSDLPLVSGGAYAGGALAKGIVSAVEDASGWIFRRTQKKNLKSCGSTFVCIVFDASNPKSATVLHVGDSRLYRLRGKELKQITRDHSVAEMMGARDESQLNPMFRGMILRAVGVENSVEVEKTLMTVAEGDVMLLCSDGLSRMLPDKRICEIIRSGRDDIEKTARRLVDEANDAGGIDNITVELVKVGGLPDPLPAVDIDYGDRTSQSSSTVGTLDCEYGTSGKKRILRRASVAVAAVCASLALGWMLLLPFVREKSPVAEVPVIESIPNGKFKEPRTGEPSAKPERDSRGSTVADAGANGRIPLVPDPPVRPTDSAAAAPDVENVELDAVEAELKKERERRRRAEAVDAKREEDRNRMVLALAKCHDHSFSEFAAFVNVILGKGTCDKAQTLCRRLHLGSRDLDASLIATDLTAEIVDIAGRLELKCNRVDRRPGGVVDVLIDMCHVVTGKNPALPEVQKGCLDLIRYVEELRRPSDVGK